MSVPFNLTHEYLKEDNKNLDELYKIHEATTTTLDEIFKGKFDNSYKMAADAADTYATAKAQAITLIDKIITDANQEVEKVTNQFYDSELKHTKPFRHLSEIQEWGNYLLETEESIAIALLQKDLNVRRAAVQYASLYNDELSLDIREITLRAFEDLHHEAIEAPKHLQEILPVLKESFTNSLENQFALESKHTYSDSVEILAGRV